MKLCKDCKYSKYVYSESRTYCIAKHPLVASMISGNKYFQENTPRCYDLRNSICPDDCGPEAKFFEAKPTLLGKLKELMNKCKPS
jgi:hypothetical protein